MSRKTLIMAIDQGTTGSTVLLFDHAGEVVGRAYSEFTQHFPKPGWVEHDANEIWEVTREVAGQALRAAGVDVGAVAAIGITNQRETTVLWDRKTGEPVHRALVWQDRRTAPFCERIKREGRAPWVRARTGLVVDAYFSASKLRWLLEEVPGLRARAERGELAFGTIDAWLVFKLSGGREHASDYSNASRTLLYNIYEQSWDEELLALFELPASILPEVRASSGAFGHTDPDAFFGAEIPIAGVAGDQQAALFGQACYGAGRAKNTYGTGSFVLMNTGTKPVESKEKLLTTIAWRVGDEPIEYALEGAVFITGAAVQWLRDGLGIIESAAETEALAASLETNDDVYFVPALTGLGAPYWDPYARGALLGLTRGTQRAHLVRAALESMCYQTRDVVAAMEQESGTRLIELRADGGAAANAFLMQFQSDLLGVPVEVPVVRETTALGAAYLAGLAIGFWSGRDEIDAKWRCAQRYEPKIDQEKRDALYARWCEAVERARGWHVPEEPGVDDT